MFRTLGFGRRVLQVTSITTSFLLLPSSVQAWNLGPAPHLSAGHAKTLPSLDKQQLAQLQSGQSEVLRTVNFRSLDVRALEILEKNSNSKAAASQGIEKLATTSATEAAEIYSSAAISDASELNTNAIAYYENSAPQYFLPEIDISSLMSLNSGTSVIQSKEREQLAKSRVVRGKRRNPTSRVHRGSVTQPQRQVFNTEKASPRDEAPNEGESAVTNQDSRATLSETLELSLEDLSATEKLAEADVSLEAGAIARAALLYFHVQDSEPGSQEGRFAVESLVELGYKAERGEIPPEEFTLFIEHLPTTQQCQSSHGHYLLALAHRVAGEVAAKVGNKEIYMQEFEQSRALCWELLTLSKNDPIAILAARDFLHASRKLGEASTLEGIEVLKNLLLYSDEPSMTRFAVMSELAVHFWQYGHDSGNALFTLMSLAEEYEAGHYKQFSENESYTEDTRAQIHFSAGYAYFQMNDRERAAEIFNGIVQQFPLGGAVTDWARYYKALSLHLLNHQDPIIGAQLFHDALVEDPNSTYADVELFVLGGIYLRAKDFDTARDVFNELVERFPNSNWNEAARKSIDRVEEERVDHTARTALILSQVPVEHNKWCGPYALSKLLEARGLPANTGALIESTLVTHNDGANLLSLADAAMESGMALQGVKNLSLSALKPPFIAHLKNHHFVFVSDITKDRVTIRDIYRPLQHVARSEFEKEWNGYALVLPELIATQNFLSPLEMSEIYGGSGGYGGGSDIFAPNTGDLTANCKNGDCRCNDCGGSPSGGPNNPSGPNSPCGGGMPGGSSSGLNLEPCYGGGSGNLTPPKNSGGCGGPPVEKPPCGSGGDMPVAYNNAGSQAPKSPNPDPEIRLTTGAPGTSGSISPIQSSQTFSDVDVSFPVRGTMSIVFKRIFNNPFGYIRGYFGSTDKPYRSNIGVGWTHNYNMHLRISSLEGYLLYYDHNGNPTQFYNSSTDATYKYYTKHGGVIGNWVRNIVIKKKLSDGTYTMENPGMATLHFSAVLDGGSSGERYCRMTKMVDVANNEIGFSYDDSQRTPFGILTKVTPPGTDSRYLEIQYNTAKTLITKVRFMADSSTEVRKVEYLYYGDWLERVRVNGNTGHDVVYA